MVIKVVVFLSFVILAGFASFLKDAEASVDESAEKSDQCILQAESDRNADGETESFEKRFNDLADVPDITLAKPFFSSKLIVFGNYDSDITITASAAGIRELVDDVHENREKNVKFLHSVLSEIAVKFDGYYEERIKQTDSIRVESGFDSVTKALIKTTAAAYLLSQVNDSNSLPLLLNLSVFDSKRRVYDDTDDNFKVWPINPKFLFYSMHILMINYPDAKLSEKARKIKTDYVVKATAIKVPDLIKFKAADWDSRFDGYGMRLKNRKKTAAGEKQVEITAYPSSFEITSKDMDELLDKIEAFCKTQFPVD